MTPGGSVSRRGMLAAGAGLALASMPAGPGIAAERSLPDPAQMKSAKEFGATGDGRTDDSAALQRALDATFSRGGAFLLLPPGTYKVARPLRVTVERERNGDISRQFGIMAHGARLLSAIEDGSNVLEISCRATMRFLLIEGLDILGTGGEGHGLSLECDSNADYFYNFCLRDIVVQNCGGDGCALTGDIFEGQIINSYFRRNKGNGITFAHGSHGGILSAIHVFGCVFGDNGRNGAALVHQCYDVAFHGCYLLNNGRFGLSAENGCTLLSNCGFENNHSAASSFAEGDAGIFLGNFGTLVGCTAYSLFHQTGLVRAYAIGQLVMIGCTGSGDRAASQAGLAKLGGKDGAGATVIGCTGRIDYENGFDAVEIAGAGGGIRFASDWRSPHLPRLGDYRLWVDRHGRLRMKRGAPTSDEDGNPVGAAS